MRGRRVGGGSRFGGRFRVGWGLGPGLESRPFFLSFFCGEGNEVLTFLMLCNYVV